MHIRRFQPDDQDSARQLILQGLGEHFGFINETMNPDLDDIASTYLTSRSNFLIAEHDGEIVGTLGPLFERAGEARIVRMSVDTKHRRLGIGTSLVRRAVELCLAAGTSTLWARTQPEWKDALSFYLNAQFVQKGRDEEDVHLCREL